MYGLSGIIYLLFVVVKTKIIFKWENKRNVTLTLALMIYYIIKIKISQRNKKINMTGISYNSVRNSLHQTFLQRAENFGKQTACRIE